MSENSRRETLSIRPASSRVAGDRLRVDWSPRSSYSDLTLLGNTRTSLAHGLGATFGRSDRYLKVNVEDSSDMLPKSRRALTIQEIAALARSSLHGISQVVKDHVTKPTAMAQGRVAHLIEWKGWCKPNDTPSALESHLTSYSHLSEGEQEARFAAGVDSRSSAFYGVVGEPRYPIMHWFSSLYVSRERQRSCPPSIRQLMASRYSTSSVSSFSGAPLRPRLHSRFQEESSIRFSRYHGDTLDQSSWAESTGGCQGYQSDEESFGGYHGEHQYKPAGNQIDWSLGDDIQAPSGSGVGVVRAMGDSYFLSVDVSGFEPHEVVLLAYNQCVVIHAEKMAADGSVAGQFTHKSVLPADMDPLSVSSSLTAERMLIISVGRRKSTLKFTSDLPESQPSSCY